MSRYFLSLPAANNLGGTGLTLYGVRALYGKGEPWTYEPGTVDPEGRNAAVLKEYQMIENQGVFEAGKVTVEQTAFRVLPMTPTQTRSTYDQLILEGKLRQEQEYLDDLKAKGVPIYEATEVAARFGIAVDATWVQKDLQRLMAVGDVFFPISGLRRKASEIHELYVVPGRDAQRAILQEVYAFYVQARKSQHCARIVSELTGSFVEKRYRKNSSDASIFVRSVFADFDDKQVHVNGKALEYCYFKNIAVVDFSDYVKGHGGLEGIRKLAMEELPKTPQQQIEADKRKAERKHAAETLARYWGLKRNKAKTLVAIPDAAKSVFKDGEDFVLRAVVIDGELCVYWSCDHLPKALADAFDTVLIDSLGYDAKRVTNGDVTAYMAQQLDYATNPPPAVTAFRELEAERIAEINVGQEMPSLDELAGQR
jgi:hypothetical protein